MNAIAVTEGARLRRVGRGCAHLWRAAAGALALGLSGCVNPTAAPAAAPAAAPGAVPAVTASESPPASAAAPAAALAGLDPAMVLNRLSWGATSSDYERIRTLGTGAWIEEQLHPDAAAPLPPAVQEQVSAMRIETTPLDALVYALDAQHKAADAIADAAAKKAAQHDYQVEVNRLGQEATIRHLLRDIYSPKQLQEQMTWFWLNHFSVYQQKNQIRTMVGDYEQQIRRQCLGRFRDLLRVSAYHPAMLLYLDNAHNALRHINENYARELLELHTLGVDGGYTQRDVQELARVLTGFGVNQNDPRRVDAPKVKRELADQYLRQGLFEFNPARHDYGDKLVLGHTIRGRGRAELDEVLDLISRHPSTARNLSRKLALYLVGAAAPQGLIDAMAREFQRTDGNIVAVLRVLIAAPAFAASLNSGFKDPLHFVVSAVRLAYDSKPIINAGPMVGWLNRLGEAPYNHQTPDGYSLAESAWDGPGQMAVRFEIAKAIGSGSAGLFRSDGPKPMEKPAFPQLANALYYASTERWLAPATRRSLEQANSSQEWNLLLLSSPEFMLR